jgi:hypothetical protein
MTAILDRVAFVVLPNGTANIFVTNENDSKEIDESLEITNIVLGLAAAVVYEKGGRNAVCTSIIEEMKTGKYFSITVKEVSKAEVDKVRDEVCCDCGGCLEDDEIEEGIPIPEGKNEVLN